MALYPTDPGSKHLNLDLGLQASIWLVRLQETQAGPTGVNDDTMRLNAAFYAWITRSPAHLTIFLDTYEAYRRLKNIDPLAQVDVMTLMKQTRDDGAI